MRDRLETSEAAGLKPLGTPGQRSFDLIVHTVEKHLGAEAAQIFAEPVPAPDGGAIDWYATIPGRARRLSDVPADEADALRVRLGAVVDRIGDLADRLAAGQDPESRRLAEALRHAVEIPDESSIFAVGDRPVLTNWAHQRDVEKAPRGALTGVMPARRVVRPLQAPAGGAPVAAAAAAGADADAAASAARLRLLHLLWWLGTLLLALLIGAILFLLVAPCGLRGPVWLNRCPAPVVAANPRIANLDDERARLLNVVAGLERQLHESQRLCRPVPTAPPLEPLPVSTIPDDEIDRRLDEAGGQRGELNITLGWSNASDLDLHVMCPTGGTISYPAGFKPECGASLNVDANGPGEELSDRPVEHVLFASDPQPGTYRIRVNLYSVADSPSDRAHPFTVRVQSDGESLRLDGIVSKSKPNWCATVQIGAPKGIVAESADGLQPEWCATL